MGIAALHPSYGLSQKLACLIPGVQSSPVQYCHRNSQLATESLAAILTANSMRSRLMKRLSPREFWDAIFVINTFP
jgi:hypothetical protein